MKLPADTYVFSENPEDVVGIVAAYIKKYLLNGESVLWLVSGGSNIKASVKIQQIIMQNNSLENLTVGLVDERYGPRGHDNSNWKQLRNAGWNDKAGNVIEVMTQDAADLTQATQNYENRLSNANESCDKTIALIGIGADGHTSGILPGSAIVNSPNIVDSFVGFDFERISTTPAFMSCIDFAVVSAFGSAKKEALELAFQDGTISDVPARCLAAAKELIVYTDNKLSNISEA